MTTYPIAPEGIFLSAQGEGALLGTPMCFVRLAGCSVGCASCDTNYSVAQRLTPREIVTRVAALTTLEIGWIYVTGGEPTDHDLRPLVEELRRLSHCALAVATSGHNAVALQGHPLHFDWVSVSPHDPAKWRVRSGNELKLVPGLNGVRLLDFAPYITPDVPRLFEHCWVQPCAGQPDTVRECWEWVQTRPGWRMSCQAHKQWQMP